MFLRSEEGSSTYRGSYGITTEMVATSIILILSGYLFIRSKWIGGVKSAFRSS